MTILEKFNRRIIELIHGKPYDEAIKIERKKEEDKSKRLLETVDCYNSMDCLDEEGWNCLANNNMPITIGRVMQAICNVFAEGNGYFFQILPKFRCESLNIHWKLTEKLGREAESEDQTEETLSQLLNLLTKIK
jgi:hypothetical protein